MRALATTAINGKTSQPRRRRQKKSGQGEIRSRPWCGRRGRNCKACFENQPFANRCARHTSPARPAPKAASVRSRRARISADKPAIDAATIMTQSTRIQSRRSRHQASERPATAPSISQCQAKKRLHDFRGQFPGRSAMLHHPAIDAAIKKERDHKQHEQNVPPASQRARSARDGGAVGQSSLAHYVRGIRIALLVAEN